MTYNRKVLLFPYLIILYEITLFLSNDMYLPSMPAISKDLFLTQHEIQSTLTIWFLGASSLQLFLGPVSDRYGRRIIIILGALFFSLSSVACAVAENLTSLLIARLVQGTSICSLVAAYAAIHELYSTKQAIKWLSIIGAVTILAPALGPLLGALIVQFAVWRYIFWFLFAMGFLSLIFLFLFMPETNMNKHHSSFKTTARDYLAIIRNPDFLKPYASYFFIVSVSFFWIFESPFVMIEMYNTSTLFYGVAQTLIFSCFFIGAAATKWVLDRYTVEQLLKYSLAVSVGGVALFLIGAIIYPDSIELAIACMMIFSVGASMLTGPLNRLSVEACKQPTGRVTAVATTSISLSGLITGIVLSLIVSRGLLVIAVLSAVCVTCATLLVLRMKINVSDSHI